MQILIKRVSLFEEINEFKLVYVVWLFKQKLNLLVLW